MLEALPDWGGLATAGEALMLLTAAEMGAELAADSDRLSGALPSGAGELGWAARGRCALAAAKGLAAEGARCMLTDVSGAAAEAAAEPLRLGKPEAPLPNDAPSRLARPEAKGPAAVEPLRLGMPEAPPLNNAPSRLAARPAGLEAKGLAVGRPTKGLPSLAALAGCVTLRMPPSNAPLPWLAADTAVVCAEVGALP